MVSLLRRLKNKFKGPEIPEWAVRIDKHRYIAEWQVNCLFPILITDKSKLSVLAYEYLRDYCNHEVASVISDSPDQGIEAVYARYCGEAETSFRHEVEVVKTLSDAAIETRWARKASDRNSDSGTFIDRLLEGRL